MGAQAGDGGNHPADAGGARDSAGDVLSPPTNMIAVKAGFKELAYLPHAGISFQHTTLTTTRRYLGKNRATALRVLSAYKAAIERIKSDKAFASKTLAKYMLTNDAEV